jgi:hypothetical protein
LSKFKKIKGDNIKHKYKYASKLVNPAISFLTKNTEIELKIDTNGTLIIISKEYLINTIKYLKKLFILLKVIIAIHIHRQL